MDHEGTRMLDRRGFMAGVGTPLGALALFGGKSDSPIESAAAGPNAVSEPMIKRTLGRTGLKMPIVSMGVMNANAPALVARSYEQGIRHFDTAWFYQRGMNETMIGDVVQRLGCRDNVIIATKIFLKETARDLYTPSIKDLFLERFAQSLTRLKTNYVDILYYHAGSEVRELNNPHVLEAFEELKKAGKVRYRGVSFHGDQAALLADMTRSHFYDVALVIFNAAMGHREIAMGDESRLLAALETAAASGIGLVAMKTQCGGGGDWAKMPGDQGMLTELNHTALLKWVLRHPFVTTAIPGYTTFDQLEEILPVARNLEYTPAEKAFLEKETRRLARSFCIQCGECRGQCPRGVDVPTLMRAHMYAYGYRNLELALATQDTVSCSAGLSVCADCSDCVVRCPRHVDVSGRLAGIRAINAAYA
jgi:predicted aldo/keto reductase-like oxidoreductase